MPCMDRLVQSVNTTHVSVAAVLSVQLANILPIDTCALIYATPACCTISEEALLWAVQFES